MNDAMETPASLLVFSDDWGRHPSSCQHLVRRLARRHAVRWVNTIGTRTPRLDRATLRRGWEKLRHWSRRSPATESADENTRGDFPDFDVVSPRMWPTFSRAFGRRLNRSLLLRQLTPILEDLPRPIVGLTTIPVVADLVGTLPVDRWVYYCVDDFSVWPGLDGRTLDRMERDLVQRVDDVIAVSDVLVDRVRGFGRTAVKLTHGIDSDHWRFRPDTSRPEPLQGIPRPIALFWGVVDRRMDVDFVRTLTEQTDITLVLLGPKDDPDPRLFETDRVRYHPAVRYDELPAWAAAADVLVMPYADLPVTRAMQPLKLKEYLATGRPVVARDLPAVLEWGDALDVVGAADAFAELVAARAMTGVPSSQELARKRLLDESWDAKAATFASLLLGSATTTPEHEDEEVPA